jgi:hypothetical protein
MQLLKVSARTVVVTPFRVVRAASPLDQGFGVFDAFADLSGTFGWRSALSRSRPETGKPSLSDDTILKQKREQATDRGDDRCCRCQYPGQSWPPALRFSFVSHIPCQQ